MLRTAVIAALVLASSPSFADQKPSETLCWLAKQARDAAGSEKAAEDVARAKHVPEAVIASAKRCPRG
jgi:hypothetical protein